MIILAYTIELTSPYAMQLLEQFHWLSVAHLLAKTSEKRWEKDMVGLLGIEVLQNKNA